VSSSDLPDGWARVRLGEVITRTSKRCTPAVSPEVRWIGADHLDEGDLSVRRWSTTDDPMFPPTFYFSVPSGSVLLHSRNPRKVAILPFDAITGEKLFCLAPVDASALDSRFLAYQLQSDHFHEFVGRWLSGSVNKFLNWTALARYEFALPPIDEQQRTVELLSALDSLAARHEVLEASIAATKTASFAGQWSCGTEADLGQIGKVATGKTPPTGEKGCWEPREVPFLAPGDFSDEMSLLSVTERHVSKSGSAVAGVISPYSVVQVCIGWSSGKVGIVLRECSSNQQVNSLQGLDPIDATYVASALASAEGRRRFARIVGTQNFPMVRKSDWSRIRIPWPGRASRESVAQRIDHLGELERLTREDRLKVYALRRTLLERCLTGVDSRVH